MAEELTPQNFKPHLNKTFRVVNGRHVLQLTAIEQPREEFSEAAEGLRQPFNLIFRGPPDDVLPEGPCMLAVDDGPSFDVYIMPIHTPARDRQNYQAAFN